MLKQQDVNGFEIRKENMLADLYLGPDSSCWLDRNTELHSAARSKNRNALVALQLLTSSGTSRSNPDLAHILHANLHGIQTNNSRLMIQDFHIRPSRNIKLVEEKMYSYAMKYLVYY